MSFSRDNNHADHNNRHYSQAFYLLPEHGFFGDKTPDDAIAILKDASIPVGTAIAVPCRKKTLTGCIEIFIKTQQGAKHILAYFKDRDYQPAYQFASEHHIAARQLQYDLVKQLVLKDGRLSTQKKETIWPKHLKPLLENEIKLHKDLFGKNVQSTVYTPQGCHVLTMNGESMPPLNFSALEDHTPSTEEMEIRSQARKKITSKEKEDVFYAALPDFFKHAYHKEMTREQAAALGAQQDIPVGAYLFRKCSLQENEPADMEKANMYIAISVKVREKGKCMQDLSLHIKMNRPPEETEILYFNLADYQNVDAVNSIYQFIRLQIENEIENENFVLQPIFSPHFEANNMSSYITSHEAYHPDTSWSANELLENEPIGSYLFRKSRSSALNQGNHYMTFSTRVDFKDEQGVAQKVFHLRICTNLQEPNKTGIYNEYYVMNAWGIDGFFAYLRQFPWAKSLQLKPIKQDSSELMPQEKTNAIVEKISGSAHTSYYQYNSTAELFAALGGTHNTKQVEMVRKEEAGILPDTQANTEISVEPCLNNKEEDITITPEPPAKRSKW